MNYLTIVRPIREILPLLGVAYPTSAPHFFIPFAPVRYLGLGA